jgi:hypothetical protein
MNSDCRFEQISARRVRGCKVCVGSHLRLTHHVVECNDSLRPVSAIIVDRACVPTPTLNGVEDGTIEQISARRVCWCKVYFGSHLRLTHHVVECNDRLRPVLRYHCRSSVCVNPDIERRRRRQIRADLGETSAMVVSNVVIRIICGQGERKGQGGCGVGWGVGGGGGGGVGGGAGLGR